MTKLVINGHHALKGEVGLSGDQQTVMAIQAASLLATHGTMILDNVPNYSKYQFNESFVTNNECSG